MKVPIPLNSSLCTDSHKNEIKDPTRGDMDLLSVNRSYLYNNHLTNAKKGIISEDGYITTKGDILNIRRGSEKTQIYKDGVMIADVLSLGVEETLYLNKDDAVIHEGSLWTVNKSLEGFIVEQTNLQTKEVTVYSIFVTGIFDIRFIRDTNKIVTRNQDGTITVYESPYTSGVNYTDPDMVNYFTFKSGEFTAVEINGEIIFGLNNPQGVVQDAPTNILNISIPQSINGWSLAQYMNDNGLDQTVGYVFNITVEANVIIGAAVSINWYALDLFSGVQFPNYHVINLTLGNGVIISGKGGDGGNWDNYNGILGSFSISGQAGTTAINVGSDITITGNGIIQGGGGGGGAFINLGIGIIESGTNGGGGAGVPSGAVGTAGTITTGGIAGDDAGNGGDRGMNGNKASSEYINGKGGAHGNAIRVVSPAVCDVDPNVELFGGIVMV